MRHLDPTAAFTVLLASISGSNDGSSFTLLKAYTGITGYTDSTYKTFATT